MRTFLAYAEGADTSDTNTVIVLIGAGLILLIGVLGFFPIAMSRGRRHRQADTILAATVLWGMIAIGTSIYVCMAQFNWAKERTTRIESGYGNPDDKTGEPKQPWVTWGVLGAGYVTLVAWARSSKKASD